MSIVLIEHYSNLELFNEFFNKSFFDTFTISLINFNLFIGLMFIESLRIFEFFLNNTTNITILSHYILYLIYNDFLEVTKIS